MNKAFETLTLEESIRLNIELTAQVEQLRFRLHELERLIFGRKSERFIPEEEQVKAMQIGLFAPPAPVEVEQEVQPEKEQISYQRSKPKAKNANHPGRHALPAHLKRVYIEVHPKQDTEQMKFIGWEITEKLAYTPAELYVNCYKRAKHAPLQGEGAIVCAEYPAHLLEKCIAEPSLMAKLCVDKYVDHLPLDRQAKALRRQGINLPTSTLYDWVRQCASLVHLVYESLCAQILSSTYIQVDESPIQVLDKSLAGKTHRGYMWVVRAPELNLVTFYYHQGRDKAFPQELLKNFQGVLQVDGYAAYDQFKNHPYITLIHCIAHARRVFEKALDNDKARATYALERFQEVYAIERKAKEQNLEPLQIQELRQAQSKPVVDQLEQWVELQWEQTTPTSPIGKALRYYQLRRSQLRHYLEDGRLEIDNNRIENAIRPLALGRKNYLFAGSHEAAQRTAIFYSLFACCAQHNINPYAYLVDVLHHIQQHHANRIEQLLPHHWADNKKTGP